jgi:tRNA pseudouridine32 synthase/23S rRNA pseudouridine746 synthase
MDALGLPIIGDQFYPTVRRGPREPEDFSRPLQLLARTVAFTDPVTGQARAFESRRSLQWPEPERLNAGPVIHSPIGMTRRQAA